MDWDVRIAEIVADHDRALANGSRAPLVEALKQVPNLRRFDLLCDLLVVEVSHEVSLKPIVSQWSLLTLMLAADQRAAVVRQGHRCLVENGSSPRWEDFRDLGMTSAQLDLRFPGDERHPPDRLALGEELGP